MDPQNPYNQTPFEQGVTVESPALNISLSDTDLNEFLNQHISESEAYYRDTMKLEERRKTNEKFWLGKQLDMTQFHTHQIPYIDNIIWQDTEQRIAIAAGRIPELIVAPGDGSLLGRQNAEKIKRALEIDLTGKPTKRLIKSGLRHNHLYYTGIIKPRWDPSRGLAGDYIFELVRPDRILIGHRSTVPEDGFTSDNSYLIVETLEESVATIIAKFPNKKGELLQQLRTHEYDRKAMASMLKYQECWFTYYDTNGQIQEGVAWRYHNLVLGKMRNPYYDWEGYSRIIFNPDGTPQMNQFNQVGTELTFRNYFERPRKPYILMSYQNLGLSPYDDTTAVEQSVQLQRNVNKRGRQITELADRITDKFAFNNLISKDNARKVTSDPNEAIWINTNGSIKDAVTSFTTGGPPPILYNDLEATRRQIDSKFQTHGTTRGENNSAESGISKQITREGDLVASDDIVEIVVERTVEEMAAWAMQFMKLMYVDTHFKTKVGKDGEIVREEIQRDMIQDGINVTVEASTADKNTARNEALTLMQADAIDPLTMFEEMDAPNPKERAKRVLAFKMGAGEGGDGFARYMELTGMNSEDGEAATPGNGPNPNDLNPPEPVAGSGEVPPQQTPQPVPGGPPPVV